MLVAEQRILGLDHAEIGFEVCKHWNIPESISNAIKFHHQPSLSEDDELDEDDGSRSLDNQPRLIDVEQLKPVSQAEEQTLLGDWGDSENED